MISSVRIKFDKFIYDTGRAILVSINYRDYWIPKKLCRCLTINKKLKGHVVIPSFFYKKMGFEVTEDVAYEIFDHHVPKKINKKITHDTGLVK